jgi:integrase
MKYLIEPYLEDHEGAWALTTWKSERARLNSVAHILEKGPKVVYEHLVSIGSKPYTIKTCFIRICALESWAKLPPVFKAWMKKHKNKFKHAYQKEDLEMSYEEALVRIKTIPSDATRTHALGLLATGLRLDESYRVIGGKVTGKGGKPRKVFGTIEVTVPKHQLQSALKAVGLKVHSLRKLSATRLAEKGASAADLMKVYGWSDIKTASIYLQGKSDERLQALMAESKEES